MLKNNSSCDVRTTNQHSIIYISIKISSINKEQIQTCILKKNVYQKLDLLNLLDIAKVFV